MRDRLLGVVVFVAAGALGGNPALAQPSARLDIDATDLPRHLLSGTMTIPLTGPVGTDAADGELALWYPKWVPGSHAPGGPVQNIGGLVITDQDGNAIAWQRTPGEIHRLIAHVPPTATQLRVTIRYITDQPSDNSHGLDSWGSQDIGIISTNTVMVCPEAVDMTTWQVETTLLLPDGWGAASALDVAGGPNRAAGDAQPASAPTADESGKVAHPADGQPIHYAATTVEMLIDCPIMAGRYHKTYDLTPTTAMAAPGDPTTPPHRLHVFSEVESAVRIDDVVVEMYRAMVLQATRMFGSHPFESMDILLGTSNVLPRNGLEHLRTTLNVIPLGTLDDPANLRGWDRMLVPHEYVHSWCGKYRRPAGMVTRDLFSPQDTELLWVYEGLTQYLGYLLEVRSGMATREEYDWDLLNRIRWARLQQGRDWRPLADTGAAAHSLRSGSPLWGHLRRSQDYYDEGSLIWLEADAIIRRLTSGRKSLDDFCQAFFRHDAGDPIPKGYDRAEVVRVLGEVAPHDWDNFLRERIETPSARAATGLAGEIGYSVQFSNEPPRGPRDQRMDALDARDSLGLTIGWDGSIGTVLLDSPADHAGLGPRMRIIGVGEYVWSRARFLEALEASASTGQIVLMLTSGDRLSEKVLEYDGGPRFMTLVRDAAKPDPLTDILRAK